MLPLFRRIISAPYHVIIYVNINNTQMFVKKRMNIHFFNIFVLEFRKTWLNFKKA